MNTELKNKIASLSNADLILMINNKKDYLQEAIIYANEEIEKRGSLINVENTINTEKTIEILNKNKEKLEEEKNIKLDSKKDISKKIFLGLILHFICSSYLIFQFNWRENPGFVLGGMIIDSITKVLISIIFILPFVYYKTKNHDQKFPNLFQLNKVIYIGLVIRALSYLLDFIYPSNAPIKNLKSEFTTNVSQPAQQLIEEFNTKCGDLVMDYTKQAKNSNIFDFWQYPILSDKNKLLKAIEDLKTLKNNVQSYRKQLNNEIEIFSSKFHEKFDDKSKLKNSDVLYFTEMQNLFQIHEEMIDIAQACLKLVNENYSLCSFVDGAVVMTHSEFAIQYNKLIGKFNALLQKDHEIRIKITGIGTELR